MMMALPVQLLMAVMMVLLMLLLSINRGAGDVTDDGAVGIGARS